MKDFTGWKKLKGADGVTDFSIQSPDSCQARMLTDPEVVAWLAVPGNSVKLL